MSKRMRDTLLMVLFELAAEAGYEFRWAGPVVRGLEAAAADYREGLLAEWTGGPA